MKKKMKKIFSKLTVLILLVGVLLPYVNIPTVEAEEACSNGEWEYHTNYYFFLAAENPHQWLDYLVKDLHNNTDGIEDGNFTTRYLTSFLYNFPADGSTIEFEDSGFVEITDNSKISENFDGGDAKSRETWTAGQYYYETSGDTLKNYSSYSSKNNLKDYAYTYGEGTEEDRIVTYLFHGGWGALDNSNGSDYIGWNELDRIKIYTSGANFDNMSISQKTDASILINNNNSEIAAKIGPAIAGTTNLTNKRSTAIENAIKMFNTNKYADGGIINNSNTDIDNHPFINVVIERKYGVNDIFTGKEINTPTGIRYSISASGEEDTTGFIVTYGTQEYKVYPWNKTNKVGSQLVKQDVTLDYDAPAIVGGEISDLKVVIGDAKDINGNWGSTTWFIAPNLYQISYKVCKTKAPAQQGNTAQVTLTYDGNEAQFGSSDKAVGVPAIDTKNVGEEFTLAATEPTLKGFKFNGWATEKTCSAAGTTVMDAGSKIGKLNENKTVFACWTTTEQQTPGKEPDTGVLTYAGLFAGVIALVGGGYYLVNKKNLFKKI